MRASHGIRSQLTRRQEDRTVFNHIPGELVKRYFSIWFFGSWSSVGVCVGSGGRGMDGRGGGRLSTILNIGSAGLYALTSFYTPFTQTPPPNTHMQIHTGIRST